MQYGGFLRRIQALGGFDDRAEAERAVRAVIGALREGLPDDDAHVLAGALPQPIAAILREPGYRDKLDLGQLRDRVARAETVRPGHAIEHLQVVCRVLGETLSEPAKDRLRVHLPEGLAEELDDRPEPTPPLRPIRADVEPALGEGHTLSTGRPGSEHPVSESAPIGAQADSIVRSENPHHDTKLSSAHGLTQERLGETLATGKPGAKKTLAGDR